MLQCAFWIFWHIFYITHKSSIFSANLMLALYEMDIFCWVTFCKDEDQISWCLINHMFSIESLKSLGWECLYRASNRLMEFYNITIWWHHLDFIQTELPHSPSLIFILHEKAFEITLRDYSCYTPLNPTSLLDPTHFIS